MAIDYMRRCDILRMTPAEKLIHEAIVTIETLGADVRLTNSQMKLHEAATLLADWIDGVPEKP
jgi:hypothetical protein